ncbi:hypothetical protein FITA111629_11005 [Filibacter tadaridae]|uniref:DUF4276 domain-containing protein n=1 Tax=Filibacter tadaridae TaxID=2483811 RepID=A0A3P5X962_9BACL|nr:hypothetical protein [Filibacter tadaridae]VDC24937.1 hypothetical protein FILTAD_01129 [Filibacter tadaridae]
MSRASRKVVIIIAEGSSEEDALYPFLEKVGKPHNVMFKVTHGDLFSDLKSKSKSPKNIIGEVVSKFIDENKFLKKDILLVAQLTDTDGTFLDESKVVVKESVERIKYTEDAIFVPSEKKLEQIVERNKMKSQRLKTLVNTNFTLSSIPYKVYYFSCNLDHAIHDLQTIKAEEKIKKAESFADSITDDAFVEFFNELAIFGEKDFGESWDFIMNEENSLKRSSNFVLFLNELEGLTAPN